MESSEDFFRETRTHLEKLGEEFKKETSHDRLLEAAVGALLLGAGIACKGRMGELIKGFPEATNLLEESSDIALKGISELNHFGKPEGMSNASSLSNAFSQGWHALEREHAQLKNLPATKK